MLNLESNKKEILINEIIELTEKTNTDITYDFNTAYNNLKTQLSDVQVGINELDKINLLNKKIDDLLNDTITFNNNLKAAVDGIPVTDINEEV